MDFDNLSLLRLTGEHVILPFDCEDDDLNDFLINDSKPCLESFLAVTYIIESEGKTIAFFSVSNDKISYIEADSGSQFKKRFQIRFPTSKRYKSYPAVKIGRLAVDRSIQRSGLGRFMLDYIKGLFITNNRTGCMYITVDAYSKSLDFYLKNGFKFLSNKDETSDTRQMYYDLSLLK